MTKTAKNPETNAPAKNVPVELGFNSRNLYEVYQVAVKLRDRLYGGTPKNSDLLKPWIESRTGHNDKLTEEQLEAAKEVLVDDVVEKSWTGFQGDEHGLFISTNNVKAMIKQGASILGIQAKKRGSKQIFAEGSEVKGVGAGKNSTRLYLGKTKPDGFEERPIHVMTAQGPRTAIKRIDFVDQPTLSFEIWILRTSPQENRHVGEDELRTILAFSQENGIGADRSQGQGKFDVIHFEKAAQ